MIATPRDLARTVNLSAARPGQRLAFQVAMERLVSRKPYTTIVLPTRYGKSDVMRLIAYTAQRAGLASVGLVLSPNRYLRSQMVAKGKMAAFLTRYSIQGQYKTREIDGRILNPGANGETLLSATIQIVARNIDDWRAWVESCVRRGQPPVILIDEAHTGSAGNVWGSVAKELADAGAYVILFTATPVRADGEVIPGFEVELTDQQSVQVWVTRPGSTPELVEVQLWEGTRTRQRLIAHHETTFAEAFAESPSPICNLSLLPFDVDLSLFDADWPRLSQMEPSALRRHGVLGKIVRDKRVIREGCQRLVKTLSQFKVLDQNAAAIIFCGNDNDPDAQVNAHARQIKKILLDMAPALNVQIVTSAIDPDTDEIERESDAEKRLASFAAGNGDVLIVKQMASVGLDVERIKVGLDLSPTRTLAALLQRMMRPTTIYGFISVAVWITPDDKISRAVFKWATGSDGYDDPNEYRTQLDNLIKTYEKPRPDEPRDPNKLGVKDTRLSDFEDTQRHYGEAHYLAMVDMFFDAVPEMRSKLTEADLAQRFKSKQIIISAPEPAGGHIDTGADLEALRDDIVSLVNALAMRVINGQQYSHTAFGEAAREVWNTLVYNPGIIPYWKDRERRVKYFESCDVEDELRKVETVFRNAVVWETYP